MNLIQAIRSRRAVRDYLSQPVSAGLIYQLIEAAAWAPSAMNAQDWTFSIVTDREVLDEIAGEAKAWMLANTGELPREGHFREMLKDPQFHILYRAPVLVVISAPKGTWARENCALAAQNLMLMATSLGLGSCWIGFAQGWLNSPQGRQALSLPDSFEAVAPIILGHPRGVTPLVMRKKPDMHWIGHHFEHVERDQPTLQEPGLFGPLIHP
ncbi:MAG TPA: nitroreductase family protein [Rhizomicrobium sp.]|nr:nitroreductase family protein [Rhizomicrobium sp.]